MHRKNSTCRTKLAAIAGLTIGVGATSSLVAQHESSNDAKVDREVKIEARVEDGEQKIRVWIDGKEHELESMDAVHELLHKDGMSDELHIELSPMVRHGGADAKVLKDVIVKRVGGSDDAAEWRADTTPRAMLGLMMDTTPEALAHHFGFDGGKSFIVTDVVGESAAAKAGLQKNDLVVALRAHGSGEFRSLGVEDTRAFIAKLSPGDEVEIKVLRKGDSKVLKTRLTEWKGEEFGVVEQQDHAWMIERGDAAGGGGAGGWIDLKADDSDADRKYRIYKFKGDGEAESDSVLKLRKLDQEAPGAGEIRKLELHKLDHDQFGDGAHILKRKSDSGESTHGRIELQLDPHAPKHLFKLEGGGGDIMFGELELDLDTDAFKHMGDGDHPKMLVVPHAFKFDSKSGELHRLHGDGDGHHGDDLDAKLEALEVQMKELRKAIEALRQEQRRRDR
ncbi:MAG: hypothetical protein ACF8PN_15025 [Phycisphaerales bacterium]